MVGKLQKPEKLSATHNALAPFSRNFAFGGLKHKKKQKVIFLKCSVWGAQSIGISSTSLEDTVSAYTASESTKLV